MEPKPTLILEKHLPLVVVEISGLNCDNIAPESDRLTDFLAVGSKQVRLLKYLAHLLFCKAGLKKKRCRAFLTAIPADP